MLTNVIKMVERKIIQIRLDKNEYQRLEQARTKLGLVSISETVRLFLGKGIKQVFSGDST